MNAKVAGEQQIVVLFYSNWFPLALGRKYKNFYVYIRKQTGKKREGRKEGGDGYSNGSRSDQRQAITLDARLGTCSVR